MAWFEHNAVRNDDDALTPAEAFAAVAVSSIYTDGQVDDLEDDRFADYLTDMRLFVALDARQIQQMLVKILRLVRDIGEARLLGRAVKAIPPELKATAFFVAADLLAVDDRLDERERGFLEELRRLLKLDAQLAANLVEAVEIKNVG